MTATFGGDGGSFTRVATDDSLIYFPCSFRCFETSPRRQRTRNRDDGVQAIPTARTERSTSRSG